MFRISNVDGLTEEQQRFADSVATASCIRRGVMDPTKLYATIQDDDAPEDQWAEAVRTAEEVEMDVFVRVFEAWDRWPEAATLTFNE